MGKQKIISTVKWEYKDRGTYFQADAYLDLKRFEEQFTRAQFELDSAVMESMVPFMPKETGVFIDATKAMSAAVAGSGRVFAAAPPYGRYLYKGKVMVGKNGSPWAKKAEKKVLVSQYTGKTKAKKDIVYSTHRNEDAQKEWFGAARKRDGKKWTDIVKRTAGGGRGG